MAYMEIGAEKKAAKCIERERYFAQLAQTFLKSHQTRKKELYKEILVIMVIELFLFIAGAITYISLSVHPALVNFLYFLIYFTVFLIFLVNIRYAYKRHIKNKSFLTIKGLSQYAKSSQSGAAELFADPVFINIISLGFWMVILSVAVLGEFINILSGHSVAGWEWIPSFLNGFIFHPVYIALSFFGLFLDRFIQSVREEVVQTNK